MTAKQVPEKLTDVAALPVHRGRPRRRHAVADPSAATGPPPAVTKEHT